MQSGTTASLENIFTDRNQHITAESLIIVCCNTFRSPSANPFWNSSLPRDRRTDSLWGYSKVRIRGQRSSPAGPANSGAGSNSPGGCSADSGSALRGSCGSWTASWWVSRSRRTRTRKKSPVASSCCDPLGCRTSVTPVRSREPGERKTWWGLCWAGAGGHHCDPRLSFTMWMNKAYYSFIKAAETTVFFCHILFYLGSS